MIDLETKLKVISGYKINKSCGSLPDTPSYQPGNYLKEEGKRNMSC